MYEKEKENGEDVTGIGVPHTDVSRFIKRKR